MHRRLSFAILLMGTALSLAWAAITISVGPAGATVVVGFDTTFYATVNGAMNTNAVTWAVNGIPGGNATVGTINTSGNYKAPPIPPAGYSVTITATSVEDPTVSKSIPVTVRHKTPSPIGAVPSNLPLGPFTLVVSGTDIVDGAVVLFNNTPLPTTYSPVTKKLTATGTATVAGYASAKIANPGPGAVSWALHLTVASSGSSGSGSGGSTPPPPPPISVTVTPSTSTLPPAGTQQFAAVVANSANQSVTWQVNGTAGGDPAVGLITNAGLYTAPGVAPWGGVVTITAVSAADSTKTAGIVVTIKDPLDLTYGRFLEQTTFGPTPALLAHAKQVGMQGFLDEQFAAPESPWPAANVATVSNVQDAFWANAALGEDQLRQRVIFALSEIICITRAKNVNGDMLSPWLQILSKNAFGNYKTLLKEITLDASMGHFLDMANSGISGGAANENYPREIMQLFSIGLNMLNVDGSLQLDGNGQPIPTYTQTDVAQIAKAFTGWTYNNPNVPPASASGAYYPGPMKPLPNGHAAGSKTFLGQTLPAGQTIQQDLDGAIDIIFNHPNVGPFIAVRLIRALVTSNPSPAYITAVANKFNDNGAGVRGDLKAVVNEIIMHPEARNDNPGPNFGRLRTPMQFFIASSRALNLGGNNVIAGVAYMFIGMSEGILNAPSVFGHYSPMFKIPNSGGLFGPEFQIYSASDATNRANFLYSKLYFYPYNPAIQPYINLGGNHAALVNAVDNTLLYGRMSQGTRTAILNTLPAMPDNNQRAVTALYFTLLSGEYQVQH